MHFFDATFSNNAVSKAVMLQFFYGIFFYYAKVVSNNITANINVKRSASDKVMLQLRLEVHGIILYLKFSFGNSFSHHGNNNKRNDNE